MKTKYQTEFHKLKSRTKIPYPVGARMTITMEKVKDMAEKLKKIFPADSLPLNGTDKPQLIFNVRGSSGAILSGLITPFLTEYEVVINYIRKSGERHHGSDDIFLNVNYPWIIIDDFIDSGETVNDIFRKMMGADWNLSWNNEGFELPVKVDCLVVSGEVHQNKLTFVPDNIIAGNYFRTI